MSTILDLCLVFMIGMFVLAGLSLWFMHRPDSPLRTIALRLSAALASVVVPVVYVLSPIDALPEGVLGPFGLFDDLFVGVAGLAAAGYNLVALLGDISKLIASGLPQPGKGATVTARTPQRKALPPRWEDGE